MEHRIDIEHTFKFRPLRVLYATGAQISVIGAGVAMGSTVMQWFGAFVLVFLWVGGACMLGKKSRNLTIKQARQRLNDIEAGHF